jgi:DNA-binding protein HU-beta
MPNVSLKGMAGELAADLETILNHKVKSAQASAILDAVFAVVQQNIVAGNVVKVEHLGSFRIQDRPARQARNPATGETFMTEPKKVLKFTAAKALKDAVK